MACGKERLADDLTEFMALERLVGVEGLEYAAHERLNRVEVLLELERVVDAVVALLVHRLVVERGRDLEVLESDAL